jgi:anti-anti-sigma factor
MGGAKNVMKLSYEPIPTIPGGLLVRLSGNLEINGAMKLWDDVSARAGAGDASRFFVFDFSDVPIVTSAGIGTLVRLLVRLRGYGGSVAIFGCSDKIKEVFSIVMLQDILCVSDNEEGALAKLK